MILIKLEIYTSLKLGENFTHNNNSYPQNSLFLFSPEPELFT